MRVLFIDEMHSISGGTAIVTYMGNGNFTAEFPTNSGSVLLNPSTNSIGPSVMIYDAGSNSHFSIFDFSSDVGMGFDYPCLSGTFSGVTVTKAYLNSGTSYTIV